jgi:hypothetical protein
MKKTLLILALCAACGGTEYDLAELAGVFAGQASDAAFEPEDTLPASVPDNELRTSYDFTIKSGHHYSNHDFVARPHLGKTVDRALTFVATFPADVAYATQNPSNQSDWNKLMGITTDRIHKNSIRIGWRWNPKSQKVELGYYGYQDGKRVMPMLADVAPGVPIECELRMTNGEMYARVGTASHTETGSMGVSLPLTWILHSAYFGGDEKAPHEMHVSVTNIVAN